MFYILDANQIWLDSSFDFRMNNEKWPTNYYIMSLTDLKEKYNKAHAAYLKHKDTNGTNNVEAQFMPEIMSFLHEQFPNSIIVAVPDCFLNYLGCDILVKSDNSLICYDVKICQHLHNTEVLIDAYSRPDSHKSLDDKINDRFIFVNADNIIITSTKAIGGLVPPIEDCFYMKRDIYKTKLKAIIDLKNCRKLVFARNAN